MGEREQPKPQNPRSGQVLMKRAEDRAKRGGRKYESHPAISRQAVTTVAHDKHKAIPPATREAMPSLRQRRTSVDSKALEEKARCIVRRLEEVASNHHRAIASLLDAVWVFSGPGTIYDKLKPGQEEWMRWMDRDRIRAGRAIVAEVTAAKLSERRGRRIGVEELTPDDIRTSGPLFVYNGVPLENVMFRQALRTGACRLPVEKVLIIDEVVEEEEAIHPIRHTADQVKSFYQALANPQSPLHGVKNVALVAHIPHFIRIPFYTRKYNDESIAQGYKGLNFWVYALRSRRGAHEPYVASELYKLIAYAELGHLATEPSPFST
jgi:hypothetical protein